MKTLKSLIALVLLTVSFGSFAADDPETANKLSMDFALKSYIDAIAAGKLKGFSEVLDNNVKFTVTRGQNIINYSKQEMISALKSTENVKQNCSTDFTVVEQNTSQALVKVTMKYEGFSKVNFVTFNNTGKGWKITNVSSSFS